MFEYLVSLLILLTLLGTAYILCKLGAIPLAMMALARSRVRINVKGGGILKVEELTSGGAVATMSDLGYLTKVDISDTPGMVESVAADGILVNAQRGSQKVVFKGVLKQTTADEINLLKNASGKFYHVYYQVELSNPTLTYQEFYAPLCIIVPGPTLSFASETERTIEITIIVLAPKGNVTVTPAGFNITLPAIYTLVDTAAAALGQVTTTNGTIYTAAV